jgi:hypothetical protein
MLEHTLEARATARDEDLRMQPALTGLRIGGVGRTDNGSPLVGDGLAVRAR